MAEDVDKLFGDVKIPPKVMYKRLLKYVVPELVRFIFALVFILFNVAFEIILPMIIKSIVAMLENSSNLLLKEILLSVGAYFLMSVISQVFLYFESMFLQKAGQNIVYRLRMEVFTHIENMSQNQFNEMPVGALVTRVANYTANLSDLFTNILVSLLRNILTIVGVYAIMFYNSWKISLLMIPFVVVVFIASFIFRKIIHDLFKKEKQANSDLNTFLSENLSGMKIIQAFNQQKRKDDQFSEKNNGLFKIKFKEVIAFGLYRPGITLIYYGAVATLFGLSYKFGMDGPTVVAINLYLSRFFNPVQNIADQLTHIQRAVTASERLFNLLDVPPEVLDVPDAIDVDHFEGRIEFKNVWFAYKEDEWILKDVSFTIEPKQTVAFVGATGAGKTTILSLIVRNFEIQKGQILIDGIDIKNIKIQSLRRGIGQMLQDVFLFSGTIRNNITLHDEEISDDEIMEACRYVNADGFINSNKKGLKEEIIENGENLSQGQKQLLSFARTIIHKPQILILDEATANIDTETEVLIQDSLEKMKNIGTMLVVAHRLSTIQKADQIIVLNHGEIIEKGNHQSLLKQKGHYYKLYKLQFDNE